jgi:hypothetical protein
MTRRRHLRTFDLSSHRSASESNPSPSNAGPAPDSLVNERLARLRRESAPRLTRDALASIAKMATSPSGPPELRALLDIPETPPLPPRDPRRRATTGGIRHARVPGPAAPPSWMGGGGGSLSGSSVGSSILFPDSGSGAGGPVAPPDPARRRGMATGAFSNLAMQPLGSEKLPGQRTLAHYALKSMAVHWEFVSTYETHNLKSLPLGMRSALLAYISRWGPESGVSLEQLKRLFVPSDAEFLRRLDFTGLLDAKFSLSQVLTFITIPYKKPDPTLFPPKPDPSFAIVDPKDLLKSRLSAVDTEDFVLDRSKSSAEPKEFVEKSGLSTALENLTWEEQADAGYTSYNLFSPITPLLFRNITHLGLGNAGHAASWERLLHIGPDLARITHLSLANWPRPSMTPHSYKARITHNHMSIPAGGTHLYSELEEDWSEAVNILRRLGKFTYCLQWLDLTGCNSWLVALTWKPKPFVSLGPSYTYAVVDWLDAWGQVTHINVSQGGVPTDIHTIRSLPSGIIACELLIYLRAQGQSDEVGRSSLPRDQPSQSEHIVRHWLETEKTARSVRNKIRLLRAQAKGKWCEFDHGWDSTCGFVEDDPPAAEAQDG